VTSRRPFFIYHRIPEGRGVAPFDVSTFNCFMLCCQGDINIAMTQFDSILRRYPRSPRAQFGKARSLNALAERRQSNTVLEQAIEECLKVLALDDVPRELFIKAGTLCADRQSFRGIVFCFCLKCFDTVGWVAGRASSL